MRPSGALKLPAEGLVVRSESLRFECGTDECAVRAEYLITASAAGRFAFEFVSPVEREVTVKIGPAAQEVTVTELARDPGESQPPRRGVVQVEPPVLDAEQLVECRQRGW